MCPNPAVVNILSQKTHRARGLRAHLVLLDAHLLQGEELCADVVAPRQVPTAHHSGLELLQTLFR